MARYQEIKEKIREKYNDLPKNQKKMADYFIDNFDSIPFLSVQEVSKETGISVASVVRFAQSTGFSGYSELRDAIAESLQSQLSGKMIFPLFDKRKVEEDLLTAVANQDIKNINDTLTLIERDNFTKAVKEIGKADRVFTAGLGISYLLAEILAYQLTQVGIDASVFKHDYTIFHEQIMFLNKKDLVIAFSFPPYSKETIEACEYAGSKGIKIISITNKEASPVTLYSDINLVVQSENMLYTNSFAAISVVINAIATECALKNKQKAEKVLQESNRLTENQKLIVR
jgi:DNA-binding MurR/RpiR family transcriptional regulator